MSRQIVRLNNAYTNQQMDRLRRESINQPKRKHLGLILVVAILLLSLASMSLIKSYESLQKQVVMEQGLAKQNDALTEEAAIKKSELTKLNDPEFLQKYARTKYDYAKSGEKIFSTPSITNGGITQ